MLEGDLEGFALRRWTCRHFDLKPEVILEKQQLFIAPHSATGPLRDPVLPCAVDCGSILEPPPLHMFTENISGTRWDLKDIAVDVI